MVIHPEGQEKPVFLALASAPGQALTLLLGPGATEQVAPSEGKRLRMAPPGGKGYPVDEAEGGDLLLFSIGSAASAITSVVEYVRANRARFGAVTLYHGAKAEDEHAYRERDEAWGADGIAVHRTTGKPWVQDVFRLSRLRPKGRWPSSVVRSRWCKA